MTSSTPSNGKTVLITGINGYIASNIALLLLQHGYTIRGTSRSPTAGTHLLSGAFANYQDRYTHYVVADITAPGAFDEAVKGVHGILHTASPVDFRLTTVDAFFTPAIQGNLSILNSAFHNAGPQFSSFVLTSSNAAIADRWRLPADHQYTESDWNLTGETIARESEAALLAGTGPFLPMVAYGASKAAAEQAMWTWRTQHNPPFSLSAINPSVVTGPPVSWPADPSGLNETLLPAWRIFSGLATSIPGGIGAMSYVDVRDVALLHEWCVSHPGESDGQRYLCTNGKGTPQAIADILRKHYPDREIVVGEPGKDYVADYWWPPGEASMVARKAYKALGVERFAIDFEKSILDTVRAFEERWPGEIRNRKA
jgi:nucleoside-diphosphate-sugar epimerase